MYYFIVNPNSCWGRGDKVWNHIEKQLITEQVEYEYYLTEYPGDARNKARELTEGRKEPKIIVVVGGSGSLNEVLDGLDFGCRITMGYIPAGMGNAMKRSLKLPGNPKRCLKKILHPKYYRMMDYGVLSYGEDEVEHRRFIGSAGIGLDAEICHSIMSWRTGCRKEERCIGRAAYLFAGLKRLFTMKPVKGYIILDGVKRVEFNHMNMISAHIQPYSDGGFCLAPKADDQDGKLTVCVIHHVPKLKLFRIMVRAYFGRSIRCCGVKHYDCSEAEIHVDSPMPVQVDGESCFCQNHIQIGCVEKKIRMIV